MSAVLWSDPLGEDTEDIKITLDTGNGEVQAQIRHESSTFTGIRSDRFQLNMSTFLRALSF